MLDEFERPCQYLWLKERIGVSEVGVEKVLNRKFVGVFGRIEVVLQALTGARFDLVEKALVFF